jgi:sphingomyelin phosphodiesterase
MLHANRLFSAALVALVLVSALAPGAAEGKELEPASPIAAAALTHLRGPIGCEGCKLVLELAKKVLNGSITEDAALDIARTYCEVHGGGLGYSCKGSWQCKDVCGGAVEEFGTVIFQVAKDLTGSPSEECLRLGYCKSVEAANLASRRTRELPSRSNSAFMPTGAPVVRVMQITDVHHDPEYTVGLTNDCGEPVCCRPPDGPAASSADTAGFFGDYNCDVPWSVLEVLAATVTQLNPDVLFLTGDDPPHNVWRQSEEFNVNVTMNVSKLLASCVVGKPVYPTLGNHNGFPVNQFQNDPAQDVGWLYGPLSSLFSNLGWLDDDAAASFATAGFYSAPLPAIKNGRVVVFNSNLQSPDNFWLWLDEGDIGGMLAWLDTTLNASVAASESVYILMHHPPRDLRDSQAPAFTNILRKYSSCLRAMFFGHHHSDYFQLVFSDDFFDAEPVVTAFVPSSVSIQGGTNPSFRIYDIDSESGYILDFHEYRMDLVKQGLVHNTSPTAKASFDLVYSMRSAYNMTDLSPYEFNRLAVRMESDDALLRQYIINLNSGNSDGSCDADCKSGEICNVLSFTPQLYDKCRQQPI